MARFRIAVCRLSGVRVVTRRSKRFRRSIVVKMSTFSRRARAAVNALETLYARGATPKKKSLLFKHYVIRSGKPYDLKRYVNFKRNCDRTFARGYRRKHVFVSVEVELSSEKFF